MNKRSASEMSIGCASSGGPTPLKSRKLNSSFGNSSLSSHSSSAPHAFSFIRLPRRTSTHESSMPVLSPCTYLTISLKNKKIKSRVDSFSLEQALFFEPYEESDINVDLLKALRLADLEKLRKLMNAQENPVDLKARNQFGENMLHIACRMGLSWDVLKFLVEDAEINLNVRDRFGRSPFHNACMSSNPNFNNINYLMKKAPILTVFEDDRDKIPFDLIPQRCFDRWSRFLSEKSIFKRLCKDLSQHKSLSQNGWPSKQNTIDGLAELRAIKSDGVLHGIDSQGNSNLVSLNLKYSCSIRKRSSSFTPSNEEPWLIQQRPLSFRICISIRLPETSSNLYLRIWISSRSPDTSFYILNEYE